MTNVVKGIVTREIGGRTVSLALGANEWCELEADLDKNTGAIMADLRAVAERGEVDFKLFRAIFRAALSYSDPDVTLREAGTLMDELGLEASGLLVVEVVKAGMPEVKTAPGKPKRRPVRT